MKITNILTSLIIALSLFSWSVYWEWEEWAPTNPLENNIVEIDSNVDWEANDREVIKNKFDELFKAWEKWEENRLVTLWEDWWWTDSLNNFLINIAKSMKNFFMVILWIYMIVWVIRMLLAESSQEEFDKLKYSLIWSAVWIVLMQISYRLVLSVYDRDIWAGLWWIVLQNVINPLINLSLYIVWFLFMFTAIFAFYKLITSDGDGTRSTEWKMWVFYWVVWVVIAKVSQTIIRVFYWDVYNCTWWPKCELIAANSQRDDLSSPVWWWVWWPVTDYSTYTDLIIAIINWANWFISIIVVILIIYAGGLVMFSNWNPDNLDKAKKSVLYIALWLALIVASFLILDFFVIDKANKIT